MLSGDVGVNLGYNSRRVTRIHWVDARKYAREWD